MHQEALRKIPRTDQIKGVLVVGVLHDRPIIDQSADADGNGLVKVEAVDGIAVFLRRKQQAEEAHKQRMRRFKIENLGGASTNRLGIHG